MQSKFNSLQIAVLFSCLCSPVFAAVTITSFTPSHKPPQVIGTAVTWTAKATDSGAGPLTFQFNVTPPNGTSTLAKDFNVGTLSGGVWTAVPFVWVPTGIEGNYNVEVVIKDFGTGETSSKTILFTVSRLVTGTAPVVEPTANPLVALFSAPSCAAGSTMRVVFKEQSGSGVTGETNWAGCHPPATMTFEVAGMLPATMYNLHAQTNTAGKITNGTTLSFQTGPIPTAVPMPKFSVATVAPTGDPNPVIVHSLIQFGGGTTYPDVATDLSGNIIWYYYAANVDHYQLLTRPLPGGGILAIQDDYAWNPNALQAQFLRQIDLAGNIVRETNIGVLQQELRAKGSPAGGACTAIASPAPVGSACIGAFHHDAIQTLPGGYTAVLVDEEKIFPAGTQGDSSGLPVDIMGDMILVLDTNWQIVWYWDVFNPAGGGNGYTELPVSRTAVLGETCGATTAGCPPVFLLTKNHIAPLAHDWLHGNSLYYWPAPQDGNTTGGDIIFSSRHQDWVFKIDYKDGTGTGNILWRMGPSGDFAFANTYNDPWPWFSHQHDVGIESNGVMTTFDNGNTRLSQPAISTGGVPGLGSKCKPYDCYSRGMALNFNETALTVTPVASLDLGHFSTAMGSAELLSNGNYFFENPAVVINLGAVTGYSMEVGPSPAAPQAGAADVVMDVSGPEHYRGFQMPSLYAPPTT